MPSFSTESRDRLAATIDRDNYRIVSRETWGHLAPRRNMTYQGVIRFAIGVYDSGYLNPTAIKCELKSRTHDLEDSPWFYDALTELLGDWAAACRDYNDPLPAGWPAIEEGGVYEWTGTFRNYEFSGSLRRMTLT